MQTKSIASQRFISYFFLIFVNCFVSSTCLLLSFQFIGLFSWSWIKGPLFNAMKWSFLIATSRAQIWFLKLDSSRAVYFLDITENFNWTELKLNITVQSVVFPEYSVRIDLKILKFVFLVNEKLKQPSYPCILLVCAFRPWGH